jgi:hypothetical protein
VKRQADVEVYLRDCPLERAVAWVQSVSGPLTGPVDCGGPVAYHPPDGAVVLTPGLDGGFLSVWFNTPRHPWDTDVECGQAAAVALGCVVRCDPGLYCPEVHPLSDVFLEIDGGTERLVEWEPSDTD